MELVPIHSLEGQAKDDVLVQSVKILNFEWPRSETIRMRGLNSSSEKLPSHLVLVQHFGGKVSVIGHSRISKIPADETQVFIESVVVHPHLRGKGLGKILMLKTEEYCMKRGFKTAYLTTHDQQIFYSRCGYKFSESVCAFGGSSSLNLGKFVKSSNTEVKPPCPAPPVSCKLSNGGPVPPPPPPPGPPPPGPPPPPKPSSIQNGSTISSPNEDLVSKCAKVFCVPKLLPSLPELDFVPEIDMTKKNEKNNEDNSEKMFMKKLLV